MHRRSLVVGIVIGGVLTRPARCGAGSDFPQALVLSDGNQYTAVRGGRLARAPASVAVPERGDCVGRIA